MTTAVFNCAEGPAARPFQVKTTNRPAKESVSWRWNWLPAVLAVVLAACASRDPAIQQRPYQEAGNPMQESPSVAPPYSVDARAWRDEQPGDTLVLHVSATLHLEHPPGWQDPILREVALGTGTAIWHADTRTMDRRPDGFEIRATGPATLTAGTVAQLRVTVVVNGREQLLTVEGVRITSVR